MIHQLSTKKYFLESSSLNQCSIILVKDITSRGILSAYYDAFILHLKTDKHKLIPEFDLFENELKKKGWNTDSNLLGAKEWRYQVGNDS